MVITWPPLKIFSTLLGVAVLLLSRQSALPQTAAAKLPPKLEDYLAVVVKPTRSERNRLIAGQPISKLLDGDPNFEVSVFGAVWINAPIQRYVDAIKDIESFEQGKGFNATKRIGAIPSIEDFESMHLPPADVEDLRSCRIDHCDVKLGAEALKRFQTEINWRSPNRQADADALMRQLALDYVKGYLDGGDQRLTVYRDSSRSTSVATEFRDMVDRMPTLTTFMPKLRTYLVWYGNSNSLKTRKAPEFTRRGKIPECPRFSLHFPSSLLASQVG
jgi:hypothetical protein